MAYAHGCYSIPLSNLPYSHSTPWPMSHHQYQMRLTSLCTALASAVYTLSTCL
ncbi:BCN_G0006790.mRNA.1.CDS.1 [Saccharomyces cerevisiae]|nr:BCN_G0006790.mRNA.1.CDS.1 [Saccharomyces cerevisiae]CAI7058853.1 BCN_G0006790.mRNA.1.CDS.1 [Saccharomyces cerevisiae]